MAGHVTCHYLYMVRATLGAGDLTRAQATRANSDGFRSAVYQSLNLADVGLPSSVRLSMRVRHVITEYNALTANAAFCHLDTSSI